MRLAPNIPGWVNVPIAEIMEKEFGIPTRVDNDVRTAALGELNYDFCEARILKSIILYDSGYLALAKNEIEKLTQEYPENILIKEYQKKINEELGL